MQAAFPGIPNERLPYRDEAIPRCSEASGTRSTDRDAGWREVVSEMTSRNSEVGARILVREENAFIEIAGAIRKRVESAPVSGDLVSWQMKLAWNVFPGMGK